MSAAEQEVASRGLSKSLQFYTASVAAGLAGRLGVAPDQVTITVVGGESTGSRRRRLSSGEQSVDLKAYVTSSDPTALMKSVAEVTSDPGNLSASLNLTVGGLTQPQLLQVSADGTELIYHPWHIQYS